MLVLSFLCLAPPLMATPEPIEKQIIVVPCGTQEAVADAVQACRANAYLILIVADDARMHLQRTSLVSYAEEILASAQPALHVSYKFDFYSKSFNDPYLNRSKGWIKNNNLRINGILCNFDHWHTTPQSKV